MLTTTDLHNHLLPGVDDGAPDLDTALNYAQRLVMAGTTATVVTPHCNHRWQLSADELRPRFQQLTAALTAADIPLTLYLGTELAHNQVNECGDAFLHLISHGPQRARWLLLEIPFAGIDKPFLDAAQTLRERGYGLLLAHPERSRRFAATLPLLMRELRLGALLQINTGSLIGAYGPEPTAQADWLLRRGLVWCLSSDSHPGTREYLLKDGYQSLRSYGYHEQRARRLVADNARFILRNGIVPEHHRQLPFSDRLGETNQLYHL
jgi:protein-tyrosine phosphatase